MAVDQSGVIRCDDGKDSSQVWVDLSSRAGRASRKSLRVGLVQGGSDRRRKWVKGWDDEDDMGGLMIMMMSSGDDDDEGEKKEEG